MPPSDRWRHLLADRPLPAALVDLDAVDHNLGVLVAASGDRPVRLATKSIRCRALIDHAARHLGERLAGLMTVSPREAAFLAEHGHDDLLTAYPVSRVADAAPLLGLARGGVDAPVVVDHHHHVGLLGHLAARENLDLPVVIEVDAAWRPLGLHLGVRRSPVRTPEQALALARDIRATRGVHLAGLMVYEAGVAAVPDRLTDALALLRRLVRARSATLACRARARTVAALDQAGFPLDRVNGGGTGSLPGTADDPHVTEVTFGSGLLTPHLFDDYCQLDLRPAAFIALPITRRPGPRHVTLHGGGYPASGAAGADRSLRLAAPTDLRPTGLEGWGEVQTPLRERRRRTHHLGEIVLARHGKAGELAERFGELLLVRGQEVVDVVPTYRGEGLSVG